MPNSRSLFEPIEPERFELDEAAPYRFEVDRRTFIEIIGAGILITVTAGDAAGQRGGGAPASLEARLHIDPNGTVTVLSGKVEEGQGPRTEFQMAAAEELGVPLEQVRVVMADTALTPNDGTTAGSRSTPGTVPAVRKAAATARTLLAALQAKEPARKLSYADLVSSAELSTAYKAAVPAETAVRDPKEWKILGTPKHRTNAPDVVTGAHAFPSDIRRPNMLYGCVLRPPSYGAVLEGVDPEAAKKTTGVVAVRDGEFAGCAAPTSYLARRAVTAMAATARWNTRDNPSSEGLYEYLKQHAKPSSGGRGRGQERGNIEAGLAGAAQRLKASFATAYLQHAPMEPRAAVAEWADGNLTVWTGTSNPFAVRDQLAQAFRVKAESVRVVVPDMGGGFGGKHTGEAALEAARLAKEAGRPVLVRWTRAEEFAWAYFRPAAWIEIEAGLDAAGASVAWDFVNYNSGTAALDTPYRIANARARYVECDAPLRQGSYRALASTANNFAREAFMDELAAAAGKDPLEFRLAHLDNTRLRDVLQQAALKFGWAERSRRRTPGRGVGLACGTEKGSYVAACVEVAFDRESGSPRLLEICQAFECGPVLNPAGLRQQVEGCIIMGLGAVLGEEIRFENGRLTNGNFRQYRVPRFRDVPAIEFVTVERKDLEAQGAGETPIIAVAPAVANAMWAATGQRLRRLPLRATMPA